MALSNADVVISSSTFYWPKLVCKGFEFRRVVHDESHLFGSVSAKLDGANFIRSKFRWNATATPMTSSIWDLTRAQLSFIEGTDSRNEQSNGALSLRRAVERFQTSDEEEKQVRFNALAEVLQKCMIRHAKSQRISGSEALALPPSTTSTVMLDMSKEEDRALNKLHTSYHTYAMAILGGTKTFTAERCFAYPMGKILRDRLSYRNFSEVIGHKKKNGAAIFGLRPEKLSKIVALREGLASLRQREPNARAVVYTQSLDVHEACVRGLKADGFEVFQFTGSTDSRRRDAAIRNFQQENAQSAAVFVVTLRSGSVGITLTAASRVYLLEPCIDPAVEVQAAGRIHRLGKWNHSDVFVCHRYSSYQYGNSPNPQYLHRLSLPHYRPK